MSDRASLFADALHAMRRSLIALRLEAPDSVVNDVEAKVETVVSGLTEALDAALGLAHFDTLDGKTYPHLKAIRDAARGK